MAYSTSGKLDWRGCEDSTPPSSTRHDLRDVPDNKSSGSGNSWHGDNDGKPSSKPTQPNKG